MKRGLIVLILIPMIFCIFLLFPSRQARCEGTAFEQLLSVFQKKGVLSSEEALALRAAYLAEQSLLKEKEARLAEKERELIERERNTAKGTVLEDAGDEGADKTAGVAPASEIEAVSAAGEEKPSYGYPNVLYDDGFGFASAEKPEMSLYLKGLLQTDYRAYDYPGEDPANDKFDVRRARLALRGGLAGFLDYYFQYEFEGAGSRRLLDAYADIDLAGYATMRLGQYKEPFGLEQTSSDQDLFFAERSMGYYLTPGRDVGASVFGNFWNDRFYYMLGMFNGDGPDDSSGGDEDALEISGRLSLSPLKKSEIDFPADVQIGFSSAYAKIDRNNVKLDVKTAGLTTFLEVASSAKFHVIRDARNRSAWGADLGVSFGQWAVWGEYAKIRFQDIEAGSNSFSFDAEDAYGAVLFMLTGEEIGFENGRFRPVVPDKPVAEGGYGAFGLAFRYDDFEADESVYELLVTPGNSVRKAKACTIALNWYLNRHSRLILDAARTDFDRPLLIYRDARTGDAIYSRREDVVTGRFQVNF